MFISLTLDRVHVIGTNTFYYDDIISMSLKCSFVLSDYVGREPQTQSSKGMTFSFVLSEHQTQSSKGMTCF